MRIQHNIAALNSYRNLVNNNSAVSKNLEKLSSGYRINRAGDDAAGLAISEKMRAQITGLNTAKKNANDGISLVQTAEGALTEVHSMLNRMVELADQSANGTYANEVDRENLQKEVKSLTEEINRISKSTNFNSINLLDGSLGLNTDTFKINAGTAETPVGTLKGDEVGTITALHKNDGVVTEVRPEFKIELADYGVTLAKETAASDTSVGLKIGGKSVKVVDATTDLNTDSTAIKFASSTTAETKKTATDVASLFDNKFAVIDNDVYKMTNTGSSIKFEYAGQKKADGTFADKDTADGKVQSGSKAPTGNVEVTLTGTGTAVNRDNCHLTDIKDPVAGVDVVRAGASLKLTKDIIERGNLKIGDVEFTFDKTKTETEATAGGDKKIIGIKDVSDDKLLETVTRQMSNYTKDGIKIKDKDGTNRTFTVGRGNGTDIIEIEESVSTKTPAEYGKFTEAELKAAFSQRSTGVKATNSVELKDTPKAGDSIKIGDKVYKFGDGDGLVAIGADKETAAKNLAAAIGSDASVNGATVTVSASALGKAAPEIKSAGLTLQIGDTADDFNQLNVEVQNMSADALGIGLNDINIATQGGAQVAIDKIKAAINTVSFVRGDLGAIQNRLEHTINNLSVTAENMTAAESRIRDVDMAEEMMAYTKNNILVQAAQAMLAQANQVPQGVLQLLQ